MERRSHQTVWTRMVKISQAQTPVGLIQGGVPLSRVITNPDDDVISNFPLFFSFFFFPFLSNSARIFSIRYEMQRSFSLPFKMRNLHPSLDIRHVDLRTSRDF